MTIKLQAGAQVRIANRILLGYRFVLMPNTSSSRGKQSLLQVAYWIGGANIRPAFPRYTTVQLGWLVIISYVVVLPLTSRSNIPLG